MSRLTMINTMKNILKTERPYRDDNGHKVKVLFLNDYILYALLREKKDFTKCATNKKQAVEMANDWLQMIIRAQRKLESNVVKDWDLTALKYRLGVDINVDGLVQLEHSIKSQIDAFNITK